MRPDVDCGIRKRMKQRGGSFVLSKGEGEGENELQTRSVKGTALGRSVVQKGPGCVRFSFWMEQFPTFHSNKPKPSQKSLDGDLRRR